ncbi:MAG: metallophosphoesterase [Bdellovibrionales bacterium]|nr:metallophosphoesterase [Bdellovibrionales bacterium]
MRKYIKIFLLLTFLSGTIWSFWIEPSSFRIAHHSISVPDLQEVLSGYKIAVIADLHTGSPYNSVDKLDEVVKKTNEENPDLILLVGDLVIQGVVGGTFVAPSVIAEHLKTLRAKDGVYGVLGNHDWWHDPIEIQEAMEGVGIPMLDENVRLIERGNKSFWLLGIGDYWQGKHNPKKTLRSVVDERPIIAFTHNPDVFPEIPPRIPLTFAGHTHGGQVYIPLIGRPIVPSKFGQKYAIGHHVENGKHLFVSPGVGTSIIPVRFLVPPEVSIITIN